MFCGINAFIAVCSKIVYFWFSRRHLAASEASDEPSFSVPLWQSRNDFEFKFQDAVTWWLLCISHHVFAISGLAVMASSMGLATGPDRESSVSCVNVDWEAFLRPLQARQYFAFVQPDHDGLRGVADAVKTTDNEKPAGVPAPYENALDWILVVLADLIGEVDPEDPLTAAGLDSLASVEFRRKLASDSGIALPQTLAFDYPTARAVADFIRAQKEPNQGVIKPRELSKDKTNVQGTACRLPGTHGSEIEDAWQMFCGQVDAVSEVPLQRFDINDCFDASMSGAEFVTYARHASMVEGSHLFDHRQFGISFNEASAIDPQQRNTLEVAYLACHHAGRLRKSLAKAAIGVFVGQCANDWAKTSRERKAGTFMGPGTHAASPRHIGATAFLLLVEC